MTSKPILIVWATGYGQTTRVAQRIASVLRESGYEVEEIRIEDLDPARSLDAFAGVIVGSRVQFGRPARSIERFATRHRSALDALPNSFFSVSMSAAGGEVQQAEATRTLTDFETRTAWHPKRTAKIAGALAYTRYNFLLRWVMKGIARREGNETDTSRDWEHTDWAQVEELAKTFAADVDATAHPEAVPA